jgi:ribosomal protein L9
MASLLRRVSSHCLVAAPRAGVFSEARRGLRANIRELQIILREDHPKLGQKGELATVRPGYARNWLIPQKLATYDTPENRELYLDASLVAGPLGADADASVITARADADLKKFFGLWSRRLSRVHLAFLRETTDKQKTQLQHHVVKSEILRKLVDQHEILGLTEANILTPDFPLTEIGQHKVKISLSTGWVAPGLGIYAEFARMQVPDVELSISIRAKEILTAEEKAEKAISKRQRRADRKGMEEAKKGGKRR